MQNNWRTNSHQKKQVCPILGHQSLDDFITFLCRKVALYKSNDLSSIFSRERERERERDLESTPHYHHEGAVLASLLILLVFLS